MGQYINIYMWGHKHTVHTRSFLSSANHHSSQTIRERKCARHRIITGSSNKHSGTWQTHNKLIIINTGFHTITQEIWVEKVVTSSWKSLAFTHTHINNKSGKVSLGCLVLFWQTRDVDKHSQYSLKDKQMLAVQTSNKLCGCYVKS